MTPSLRQELLQLVADAIAAVDRACEKNSLAVPTSRG